MFIYTHSNLVPLISTDVFTVSGVETVLLFRALSLLVTDIIALKT